MRHGGRDLFPWPCPDVRCCATHPRDHMPAGCGGAGAAAGSKLLQSPAHLDALRVAQCDDPGVIRALALKHLRRTKAQASRGQEGPRGKTPAQSARILHPDYCCAFAMAKAYVRRSQQPG